MSDAGPEPEQEQEQRPEQARGRAVEKKKRMAQAMIRLGKGLFVGDARGAKAQGSGSDNRHGLPKLPIGQHEVKHWPRLDLGVIPTLDAASWTLSLEGLCDRPQTLSWDAFMALPQVEDVSDFHCVTTWSRFDNRWRGVRFATLAELCGVRAEARFVFVTAYDQAGDVPYTTNLSLERALEEDVLLVHTWEGEPLTAEHGGPVRMITPRLYAWKGAKWIRAIRFQAEDSPGFWEARGYSMTAIPWVGDRYRRR